MYLIAFPLLKHTTKIGPANLQERNFFYLIRKRARECTRLANTVEPVCFQPSYRRTTLGKAYLRLN